MKSTPKAKRKQPSTVLELPVNNVDMENFINANRERLHQIIIDNITIAVDNKSPTADLFTFAGSDYVVLINQRDFKDNVENVLANGLDDQKYELCARAKELLGRLAIPRLTRETKTLKLL